MTTRLELSQTKDPDPQPCPSCGNKLMEKQLLLHFLEQHNDKIKHICPFCPGSELCGSNQYGFLSHAIHRHYTKLPMQWDRELEFGRRFYPFSLVIVRHPENDEHGDTRFLLVEETDEKGWWLPGGHVDPGETFIEAAIRETKEEGGIDVRLDGILKIEHMPFASGGGRMRVIFLASPIDPKQEPKSVGDHDSVSARFVSWKDVFDRKMPDGSHRKCAYRLRGHEPREWFQYVVNDGHVAPMNLLGDES